jgi:hypothetical protein
MINQFVSQRDRNVLRTGRQIRESCVRKWRKISPPPGFDSRTVQPAASRYTDWYIPAQDTHSTANECFSDSRVNGQHYCARSFLSLLVTGNIGGEDTDNRTHKLMMFVNCFTLLTVPLAGAVHIHNLQTNSYFLCAVGKITVYSGYFRRIPA